MMVRSVYYGGVAAAVAFSILFAGCKSDVIKELATSPMLPVDVKGLQEYSLLAPEQVSVPEVKKIKQTPMIFDGPLVCQLNSSDPGSAVITFKTSIRIAAEIVLDNKTRFREAFSRHYHEIKLTGLKPGQKYQYRIDTGKELSGPYHFTAAPSTGQSSVSFAFTGACSLPRTIKSGKKNPPLVFDNLKKLAKIARKRNAGFLITGGDFHSGSPEKAELLESIGKFKEELLEFWRTRPVYVIPGEHETVMFTYELDDDKKIQLDMWPYGETSTEAVFASAFSNPENAPAPSDPRRPSYQRNTYSFQYGNVKIICLNNSYWLTKGDRKKFGGNANGYVLDDQLQWLKKELESAEKNQTIKHVFVVTHCPLFPNNIYVSNSMWYDGNNNIRSYTCVTGKVYPAAAGIVTRRNQLAELIGNSRKVAAVFSAHDPDYSRVLINSKVSAGIPEKDDKNGDNKIDWRKNEPASPLASLKYPVWYLTSGDSFPGPRGIKNIQTPWNQYWQKQKKPKTGYNLIPRECIFIVTCTENKASLEVISPDGKTIDRISNLKSRR